MANAIKVTAKISKQQLAAVERIVAAKIKLVEDNLETVMKTEAIPHLIDLVMDNYDKLSARMDTLPDQHEDPTNPANWRDVFKAKLEEDATNTFIFDRSSGIIKVNLGEKSFLGYGGEPDTSSSTPLVWMVYYIEGLAGSWGWITKELWQQVFPDGDWDPNWGRFQDSPGFMLSAGDFFARTKRDGSPSLWRQKITWSEIRHPFSAFSPLDIFEEALNEFNIRPFTSKAVRAALQGKRL